MKTTTKVAIGTGIAGVTLLTIGLLAKPKPEAWVCPYCGEEFPSKELLEEHIASEHPLVEPPPGTILTCPYCGAIFTTEYELTYHLQTEHPEETPVVIYTCPHCGAPFLSLYELSEHIASQHPTISPPAVPVSLVSATLNPITYKTTDYSPTIHKVNAIFSASEIELPTIVGGLKSFWSYIFFYVLPNPFTEPVREKVYEVKCPYCDKVWRGTPMQEFLSQIDQHMIEYHPNVTFYYMCRFPDCYKSFLTVDEVVSHMQSVHQDTALVFYVYTVCPYCGQFITLGTGSRTYTHNGVEIVDDIPSGKKLTEHITATHPGMPLPPALPIFICQYCGKGYVTQEELIEHQSIYHPERPWIIFAIFDGNILVPDKDALIEYVTEQGGTMTEATLAKIKEPGTYELTSKADYLRAGQITDEGIRKSVKVYNQYKQYLPPGTYPAYAFCWRSQVVLYKVDTTLWGFLSGVAGANAKGWILKDSPIGDAEIKGLV